MVPFINLLGTLKVNKRIISAMSRAIFDSDLIASRILLAWAEFLWAVMLFWPGDTFGRPTYAAMAHIMNEQAWGFVFAISSAFQITIILQESFHTAFARYFAAWNATLWAVVVIGMLLSVYPPPAAISGEIALAFAAGWIWIRPYILTEGIRRAGYYTSSDAEKQKVYR